MSVSLPLWSAFLRLLASVGFGAAIGFERELGAARKRLRGMAGIRTHMLIAVGSCLIQLVSVYAYASADIQGSYDPSRVAAQAVSGIGFVGAGCILRGGNTIVHGLTTAASIWFVMALGLAVGIGYWLESLVAFLLVGTALFVFGSFEKWRFPITIVQTTPALIQVSVVDKPGVVQNTLQMIQQALNGEYQISDIQVKKVSTLFNGEEGVTAEEKSTEKQEDIAAPAFPVLSSSTSSVPLLSSFGHEVLVSLSFNAVNPLLTDPKPSSNKINILIQRLAVTDGVRSIAFKPGRSDDI